MKNQELNLFKAARLWLGGRILGLRSTDYSTLKDPARWLFEALTGGRETSAGVTVTPEKALQSTAVFACVRVLAEGVASLPLIVYERKPSTNGRTAKQRARDFDLYQLLHDQPNEFQTSFEFREMLQGHLALRGNAFAYLKMNGRGRIEQLIPLNPDRVIPHLTPQYRKAYKYQPMQGPAVTYLQDEIFHVAGISSNGIKGLSPIDLMREAVGLTLAAEIHGSRHFANGVNPSGVLKFPGKLGPEARTNIRESIEKKFKGADNAFKFMLLEQGAEWQQMSLTNQQAQFLETRKFQVNEIARIFRVPPHLIGDLERATFSNIEHQGIEFVTQTLRPWLVRWEQCITRDLLLERERDRYYAEFLVDGLLRGDIKTRYEAYGIARDKGWLSANDIRQLENQNPIPDEEPEGPGDLYLLPLNMVPAHQLLEPPELPPPDEPPDGASSDDDSFRALAGREPQMALTATPEERKAKAATRRRIREAHFAIFKDYAGRLIRRDIKEVKAALKKFIKQRDARQFSAWLEEHYAKVPETAKKHMRPLYEAFSRAIAAEAAAEANNAELDFSDDFEAFISSYAYMFGLRYAGRSENRLQNELREAIDKAEDIAANIEAELADWEATRADKIAAEESVRSANAITKWAWAASGVISFTWVAFGRSCGLCEELDGRSVSIKANFANPGDQIGASGASPLDIKSPIGHPPLHGGCDCEVIIG